MSSENTDHIRIMMLVASLPPSPVGGAEIQALRLGRALGKKKVSVSFIAPGNAHAHGKTMIDNMPVYRLHSWLNRLFVSASALKKRKQKIITQIEYDDSKELTDQIIRKAGWATVIYYNIFFFHALLFLWRRRKSFDIIHAHTMEWSAIVSARLGKILGKPVIIKDSTMNGFQSLSRFPSGKHLQKMIIKHAQFVAMTKIIYHNLLQAGIPAEKITIIPNGIEVDQEIKHPGNKEKTPKVLFIGNLYQQPAKGVDILLKAWAQVHKNFPSAILQIIGDGVTDGYRNFVERLRIQSAVIFLDKQTNPDKYFDEADIFVLPSRREGMSNALMEAMLHAVPCVATDISGSQDLIRNDINGILVPSMDPVKLAEGICYLLVDPNKALALGKKGQDTIIKDFNMLTIADKYISLYIKLLKLET